MPKSSAPRIPSIRRHKPTGRAVVTIKGRDIYLGKWNTAASRAEYGRLIAEFLANGRQLRDEVDTTVVEVINAYRKYAEQYYRKNGQVTREYGCIKEALKIIRELYGRKLADDFGPLALKALRQRMVDNGWSRGYINKSIGRIRDSQTVRVGSRPSHPGARFGRRHASLRGTGSAKGGRDHAGGWLTRRRDFGPCNSQHRIERRGQA